MKWIAAAVIAPLSLAAASPVVPTDCPLKTLNTLLPEGTALLADPQARYVLFPARLRRDDDGAPNAYHPCGASYADEQCGGDRFGLDHICSGVTVLDAGGKEVPRSERPDPTKPPNSRKCLAAFRAVQAADYPLCWHHVACVSAWPGVALATRQPPPGRMTRVPRIRHGGPYDGYYVSQTTLSRTAPAEPDGRSYLDARRVPYVVVPGRSALTRAPWNFGSTSRVDLALVIAKRNDGVYRAVFAVVGEIGPASELGEVSNAVLQSLQGGPLDDERPRPAGIPGAGFPGKAIVILFRHSTDTPAIGAWPKEDLTAAAIKAAGTTLLGRVGGLAQLARCTGLPGTGQSLEFAQP